MIKKIIITISVTLVFLALGIRYAEGNGAEPVTIVLHPSLRGLTLDDLINEAELIVIGKVKTVLPSRWKAPQGAVPENISHKQIVENNLSIFTDSFISVEKVLKGVINQPVVRVRSFVGQIGHVQWINSSEPQYREGQAYLLFLHKDDGPTQIVDPGDYIAVNAIGGVYEINGNLALSIDDEWVLEDLIAYIENALQASP